MPRPNDFASLGSLGPGSIPKGAVEDVSLRNPDRDTLPLTAHVQDPSRAHMASSTGIVDAGGYYAADEVEGALQEIGGSHSEGRQNGVVTGFGYSAAGLVVTFATPSTALVPNLRDYSGESLTLPNNTPSVWVYIDPSTGLITQFVGANPPNITSPENLLLWQFTTSGGAVTGARDARLYVRNLDRKLPFTVRAFGAQADQESEACFVTLDAALVYLQYSVPLNGLRTEVVLRGPVTTGPVDLPVDGVQFRGEDGATITLTSGAYLFDLKGKDGVSFSDLTLTTDVPGATAIKDSVGPAERFSLTRCVITSGGDAWTAGVNFLNLANVTISGCSFRVSDVGISAAIPDAVLVDNTVVEAINFGSTGIRIGVSPLGVGARASVVRGCTVIRFDVGVEVVGVGHVVSQCKVTPGNNGAAGILVGASQDVVVTGCRVDCSTPAGQVALAASGTASDKVTGLKVTDNTFYGARSRGVWFQGFVQQSTIQGNVVDCYIAGFPGDPTAEAGIYLQETGGDAPSYNTIRGNTVWRAKTGIYLIGTSGQPIVETVVSDNLVHHCAVGVAGVPAPPFETSTGIGAAWCENLNVTSNNVSGIGTILTDAGTVVQPTPANVYANGVYLQFCTSFAVVGNQVDDLQAKGVGKVAGIYSEIPGSVVFGATGVRIAGNQVSAVPGGGILVSAGANAATQTSTLTGWSVSGNTLVQTETGITLVVNGRATATDFRIESNTVTDASNRGIDVSVVEAAVGVPSGVVAGVQVVDNTVHDPTASAIRLRCQNGTSASQVGIDRNVVRLPQLHGIEISVGAALGAGPALFEDVSVSGNNLAMTGLGATDAIRWLSVASSIDNVRIDGNVITNAVDGIDLSAVGSGSPVTNTTLSNFTFRGNKVIASGRGFFGLVGGFVNGWSVTDNTLNADNTVFQLAPSAVAASSTASSGILLSRNRFVAASAGTNTQLLFSDMKVSSLFIEDNTFAQGVAASLGGIYLSVSGAGSGTAPSVRDLAVRRNTFRDMECAGIAVTVAGPVDDAVNLDFSDNTFDGVATDSAGTPRASVFLCDIQAVVRNMSVRNNRAATSGHSSATHGGLDLTLRGARGLDVSGNQFDDAVGLFSAQYGSIVHLEASGAGDLQDVTVCKNKSRGVEVPSTSTSLSLISLDLRNFSSVENLSVCDNDLDRVDNSPGGTGNTHGVYLQTTNDLARFSCNRNRVTGVGSNVAAFYLDVGAAGASEVSVSGNYVTGVGTTGASGKGIWLDFAGAGSKIRVCDNTLTGNLSVSATNGILIEGAVGYTTLQLLDLRVDSNTLVTYRDPITVVCDDLSDLSFSGNQALGFTISNFSPPDPKAAFRIVATGVSQRLEFSNNKCQSNANDVRGWLLGLGDSVVGDACAGLVFSHNMVTLSGAPSQALRIRTEGVSFKNFVFTGNVFRGSSTGIGYLLGGGPPPDQCTFMGNIGDSAGSWSQFANLSTAGWTNVLPDPIATFQNFNIDDGT